MHAMGMPPSLVMEVTDELATSSSRRSPWRKLGGGGPGGTRAVAGPRAHAADGQCASAYTTVLESEHPVVVQRVRELGEAWGNDPGVITLFGTLVYDALSEGTMTPAKEALLLRRAEKQAKAEAAGRARAAEAQREAEAEGDEARAEAMTGVAQAHSRWGKQEP